MLPLISLPRVSDGAAEVMISVWPNIAESCGAAYRPKVVSQGRKSRLHLSAIIVETKIIQIDRFCLKMFAGSFLFQIMRVGTEVETESWYLPFLKLAIGLMKMA